MLSRGLIFGALLFGLSACGSLTRDNLTDTPDPIGDFRLGFSVVVAPDPVRGPLSREASGEELAAAVKAAVDERLSRYEGSAFYHVGISVDGYVLGQPGVPLVYTPKSTMIFNLTVYEDATQQKLMAEAEQLTVFEGGTDAFLIGSGWARTREEQIENLAFAAARAAERWMRNNSELFAPGAERFELTQTEEAPAAPTIELPPELSTAQAN